MKNIIKIFLIFAIITSMASAVYYPYKSTSPLSADISMNNHKLTDLAAPTASNDAATKAYVDSSGGSGGSGGVSYIIKHDASTIYGYNPDGGLVQSASYTTPGGFSTVMNAIITDINTKDIGAQIVIGLGNYYPGDIDILEIPPFVTVSGINYPFVSNNGELPSLTSSEMTRICRTNTANTPFKLYNAGSSIEKISIVYPNQATETAPTVYSASIKIGGGSIRTYNNVVRYIDLGNSYSGIELGYMAERAIIEHIVGFPLKYGIVQTTPEITDIVQISDVHFNPMNAAAYGLLGYGLIDWVQANGDALTINRIDGLRVRDFFCIWYNKGIVINGPLWRASFQSCYLDGVNYGIVSSGAVVEACDFTDCHIFSNIVAMDMQGSINANSFVGTEVDSYRDGIIIKRIGGTTSGNVFSDGVIRFHKDSNYTGNTVRGALITGDGWTFSNNIVYGVVSTESQGLLIADCDGFVVSNNVFENLAYSAVELWGSDCNMYQISGNTAKSVSWGFPADISTTSKFIGHNVYY